MSCIQQELQTALHIAARLGNVDNVALLLKHGAVPDAVTKDLYTALHIAAKEGHEEVVLQLLEQGANHSLTTKVAYIIIIHCLHFICNRQMNDSIVGKAKYIENNANESAQN